MLANATKTNPSLRDIISQGEPNIVHNPYGNALVLTRVLYQSEDEVEIEGVSNPPMTALEPIPSHLPYIATYVGRLIG